jgi:ribosomal-protein-alanine N-acetyltransferase
MGFVCLLYKTITEPYRNSAATNRQLISTKLVNNVNLNMLQLTFIPFPILHTERLLLRPPEPADAERISLLRSDEAVNRYLDRPRKTTIEDADAFIKKINAGVNGHQSMYWVICLQADNQLVGTICYWNIVPEKAQADIGFELLPAFQGKGIMQEALEKMIAFGWEKIGLQKIVGITAVANEASRKLLEKNNFAQDSSFEYEADPAEQPQVVYTLSRPAGIMAPSPVKS